MDEESRGRTSDYWPEDLATHTGPCKWIWEKMNILTFFLLSSSSLPAGLPTDNTQRKEPLEHLYRLVSPSF